MNSRGREGTMLIEMLGYFVILAIIINIGLTLFVSSTRLSLVGMNGLERLSDVEAIRRDFVESVRRCTGVVDVFGEYRTGSETLVLRMPVGEEAGVSARYTVWGGIGKEGRFSRLDVVVRDGRLEPAGFEGYRLDHGSVRFAYDRDSFEEARLVTAELRVRDGEKRRGPYVFTCAVRRP